METSMKEGLFPEALRLPVRKSEQTEAYYFPSLPASCGTGHAHRTFLHLNPTF